MARGENPSQVERMRAQGYTEEEIEDMLKCDREIDRGADLFPLAPELEQGAKKARRADRTDTPKKAVRPEDTDKRRLIEYFRNALENEVRVSETDFDCVATKVEIVNPEREFLFTYCGRKYKVVMSVPRGQ